MSSFKGFVFLFLLVIWTSFLPAQKKGHEITVKVKGIVEEECYLAYHYGDKQYIKDTLKTDKNGILLFKGDEPLDGGIYLVVMPDKKWFEMIVGEDQFFSIETDASDLVGNIKVNGSKENQSFYGYQHDMVRLQTENARIQKKLDEHKENEDSTAFYKALQVSVAEGIIDARDIIIEDHPDFLFTKVLLMMKDIEIPESPRDTAGNLIDSLFDYHYLKLHYFDYVDFEDARVLRTPVYHNKLKYYYDRLVPQHPDTICLETDRILEKCIDYDIFKYSLITIFNKYVNSKVMGMEKVYLHIALNYYLAEETRVDWADSTYKAKMDDRVKQIIRNQLDSPAPPMFLQDMNGQTHSLYNIKGDYTVLVFWEPSCGHCKSEMPHVKALYDTLHTQGVTFIGISINRKLEENKKFIEEQELPFMNLYDQNYHTDFKILYDVYSTPVIYILDENKKIKAKRIGVDQIKGLIEILRKEKEREKKKEKAPQE